MGQKCVDNDFFKAFGQKLKDRDEVLGTDGFFNRGFTIAALRSHGTMPIARDV